MSNANALYEICGKKIKNAEPDNIAFWLRKVAVLLFIELFYKKKEKTENSFMSFSVLF